MGTLHWGILFLPAGAKICIVEYFWPIASWTVCWSIMLGWRLDIFVTLIFMRFFSPDWTDSNWCKIKYCIHSQKYTFHVKKNLLHSKIQLRKVRQQKVTLFANVLFGELGSWKNIRKSYHLSYFIIISKRMAFLQSRIFYLSFLYPI